jgi:hypothetical protein
MSYVPATRERVQLRGEPGIFFVIAVDADAMVASLVRLDREREARLEEDVPFGEILPIMDEMPSDAA